MTQTHVNFLLQDLARWTFGSLLAERAQFNALEAQELASEVRAYRYGILCTILKWDVWKDRAMVEPAVGAPWELLFEWSCLADGLVWGEDAERALAGHFIGRMQRAGSVTEPLRRFALGKAHKYGRRVIFLSEKLDS
jgi:hypothetical protein